MLAYSVLVRILALAASVVGVESEVLAQGDTPTPTVTMTPTPSKTPSATPRGECMYLEVNATEDWIAFGADDSWPPSFFGCSAYQVPNAVSTESLLAFTHYTPPDTDPYVKSLPLLRWDIEGADHFHVERAWLRLQVFGGVATSKSLAADWYDWTTSPPTPGPTGKCDESDYSVSPASDALSIDGACDSACLLSNMLPAETGEPGIIVDLELDNAGDHLDLDGSSYLRLHVPGDPTLGEGAVAFGSAESDVPPRLVLMLCLNGGSPTPTPPPDCEWRSYLPEKERGLIRYEIEDGPTVGVCFDPIAQALDEELIPRDDFLLMSRQYPVLPTPLFVQLGGFLSWDLTSDATLDPGEIVAARLDLGINAVGSQTGTRLEADWYHPPAIDPNSPESFDPNEIECLVIDYDSTDDGNALSVSGSCGAHCLLDEIPQPVFLEQSIREGFDLDIDEMEIDEGRVQLAIRIKDTVGVTPLVDLMSLTSSRRWDGEDVVSTGDGPRLALLTCRETPTICPGSCGSSFATPTPVATVTATPTMMSGCSRVEIPADEEWDLVAAKHVNQPLAYTCYSEMVGDMLFVGSAEYMLARYNHTVLLRWDTSDLASLYPNAVIERAWLRASLYAAGGRTGKSLEGDWYDWYQPPATVGSTTPTPTPTPTVGAGTPTPGACDASDAGLDGSAEALSKASLCGRQCDLRRIFPSEGGGPQEFELTSPGEGVHLNGQTFLRLHVDDDPLISWDAIEMASSSSDPNAPAGPSLVLWLCPE